MALQRLLNWIVAYLFRSFAPKVSFVKAIPEAETPTRRDYDSLGYDLYAPYDVEIEPGGQHLVDTGLVFDLPPYLGMFLWDKSSLARKHRVQVCAGVVDPDYRGRVGVILRNRHPERKFVLSKGSPIAQAVFHLAVRPDLTVTTHEKLTRTNRGERGFGGEGFDITRK